MSDPKGVERVDWYRQGETGEYVCQLCELRALRDRHATVCIRPFRSATAVELREHFRGHRDKPTWPNGEFLGPESAPLDTFVEAELLKLERLARAELSYDRQCEELADYFLSDYPQSTLYDRARLAQHVQEAVEGWLETEMEAGQ